MLVRLAENDIAHSINPDYDLNYFHAVVQLEADMVACLT